MDDRKKWAKEISKAHYKKAQAYLQYINRANEEIKLGFLELKQAYDFAESDSSDRNSILSEMHRVKKEI